MADANPKFTPTPQPAPTAEPKKSPYRKILEELGLDAGVSAVVFALFKQFGKDSIVVLAENLVIQAHKSFEDHRGELMRDVILLPADSKRKFFKWYEEAKAKDKNKEKDFIMLLSKLPKDKDGSRIYVLKELCALTDKQFDDLLSALEHDNLKQFVMQFLNRIPSFLKMDCDDVETSLSNAASSFFGGLQKFAQHINRGLVGSTPTAKSLTNWFDEH